MVSKDTDKYFRAVLTSVGWNPIAFRGGLITRLVRNANNATASIGDSLFSRDARLKLLEDNCPRIYSCQSRSIFFTRPFVTGHSLAAVRFSARLRRAGAPSRNEPRSGERWINRASKEHYLFRNKRRAYARARYRRVPGAFFNFRPRHRHGRTSESFNYGTHEVNVTLCSCARGKICYSNWGGGSTVYIWRIKEALNEITELTNIGRLYKAE